MIESTNRRTPTTSRARWLFSGVMATCVLALGTPALLHAQARQAGTAAAPGLPGPTGPAPQVSQTPAAPPTPAAADALALGRGFSEVAERTLPSVVSIRVEATADDDTAQFTIPFGSPFGGQGGMQTPMVHGEGSGVIVRQDGVILTNNHVVEHAERLTVRLHDGRTYRARVLGTDPATDLALVHIDATGLPAARLGDSDQARVGEFVLAIGAPLGLEATVTHGVVSATGRGGIGANEIEDYLQTDASINPGNSGGPLVDLRGEVLGINNMIVGRNTGIGLAIPSRIAQNVIEQILRNGRVSRGWIGVGVQDLSGDLAQTMGVNSEHGAVVNQVEQNAPAAHAGLEVGDVVTAIDGRPIGSSLDLVRVITRRGVGERITLNIVRHGRAATVAVTTATRPGTEPQQSTSEGNVEPTATHSHGLGLRVATMSPDLAARLGAPADSIVVAGIVPGSAADEAGLRRGDVILQADGRPVHSTADVLNATRSSRHPAREAWPRPDVRAADRVARTRPWGRLADDG